MECRQAWINIRSYDHMIIRSYDHTIIWSNDHMFIWSYDHFEASRVAGLDFWGRCGRRNQFSRSPRSPDSIVEVSRLVGIYPRPSPFTPSDLAHPWPMASCIHPVFNLCSVAIYARMCGSRKQAKTNTGILHGSAERSVKPFLGCCSVISLVLFFTHLSPTQQKQNYS